MIKYISFKRVKTAPETVDINPSNKTGIPNTLAAITDPAMATISLPAKADKISYTQLNFSAVEPVSIIEILFFSL